MPAILITTGVVLMAGIGTTIAVNSGKNEKNIAVLDAAREESAANRENTVTLANRYINNGDYDQAMQVLNSYLAENPGDEEARSLLEKAQIAKLGSDGSELSPEEILANYNSMIASGDYDRAANYISQKSDEELAAQGINRNNLLQKAMILSDGRDLLNKGEYDKAGNLLENYLAVYSRDSEVENMLAQVRRLETLSNQGLDGAVDLAKNDLDAPATDVGSASEGGDLASLITNGSENTSGRNVYTIVGTEDYKPSASGTAAGTPSTSNASTSNVSANQDSTSGRGSNPSVTVLNSGDRLASNTGSTSSAGGTSSNGGRNANSGTVTPVSSTGNGFGGLNSTNGGSSSSSRGSASTGGTTSSTGSSAGGRNSSTGTSTASASTGTTPSTSGATTSGRTTSAGSSTPSTAVASTGTGGTTSGRTSSTGTSSSPSTGSTGSASSRGNSDIGGAGSLSGLLASAAGNSSGSGTVGSDGTKTSPEVLLRKYGTRAISRGEALDVGKNFIDDGKYDECINLMNELLTLNSKDPEARRLLEEARALKKRYGGNGGARTSDQNLDLAKRWIDSGNYDDAITLLNSILNKDPDNARAKELLDRAMELKGGKNPEKTAAERADKLSQAMKLINEGKYDEAQAILNQLLADNPNDTQAKNLLGQLDQKKAQRDADNAEKISNARNAINGGDYESAIDILNEILKNDPNNAEAKNLLAQAKSRQAQAEKDKKDALDKAKADLANGNPDDAVKALEKYLADHPDDKEAQKLLEQAKNAQAREEKERADKADKINQAREALKNGDYEKAAALLNEILKDDPNNAEAKNLLAQTKAAQSQAEKDRADKLAEARRLIENGEYDKAQQILDELLKDNPNDADAKKLSSEAKTKKTADEKNRTDKISQVKKDIDSGNYDKAIAQLNQILKDDPNNAEAKKLLEEAQAKKAAAEKAATDAKISQAKKDIGNGDYEKAIANLNQILKDDPNNAEAKKLLEEAKTKKADADRAAKLAQAKKDIDSGNYDKAIAQLNQILKDDPNNAEAKKLLEEAQAKKKAAEDAQNKAKERTDSLAKARSLINSGDYDGAIAILEELLKDNPNDTQAKNLLSQAQTKKAAADRDRANKLAKARTDIDSGNYDSAISAMNGLLKNNPNDADAKKLLDEATAKKNAAAKDRQDKLAEAQRLIDAGDYEGAAKILDGLLGTNSGDSEAKNLLNKANKEKAAAEEAAAEEAKKADLQAVKQKVESEIAQGKAAIAKGNANDALTHFANARDLLDSTENPYAAEKLGDMAKSLYDAAQNAADATTKAALNNAAAQYASEAVAKNSNNPAAHYVLGMRALDARNYQKAEEELTLATKQDPTNGVYWYQLGRVQAMQQKFGPAAASFQNAIKYEPTLASAYYNLGYVQDKSGNQTAALESYKNAYRVDPKYEKAYIAAARLMANKADYSGAAQAFSNAVKINPSNAQTYQELGSAYANMGDYKSAETNFRKALAYMDPSKPDAATYYNLSSVLAELEKYSEGVNYAALAYNNRSTASKALQVNIIYNYGFLSEKTGETSRASSLYTDALALDSTHLKSKINLGALYVNSGDVDTGISLLKSADAQSPNNFEINNNLGNAYRTKGDYTKAITHYQTALRIDPTDNVVRENLAKTYASAGQYSNSKMTYEDVIAADPENWSAYLECAKVDVSLGNTQDAIEKLEYLQQKNPSYSRLEVSTLLSTLR